MQDIHLLGGEHRREPERDSGQHHLGLHGTPDERPPHPCHITQEAQGQKLHFPKPVSPALEVVFVKSDPEFETIRAVKGSGLWALWIVTAGKRATQGPSSAILK